MKQYEIKTNQNHDILEIWKGVNEFGEVGYFVIAHNPKNEHWPYEWGAYYDIEKGYWGYGHYGFTSLAQARKDMLSCYKEFELDLIIKNKLGEF